MTALMWSRRVLSLRNNLFKTPRRNEGYYVLLPEIGEDLPEKNPLLKEDTMLPEFNGFTIERCIATVGKQAVEFEQTIKALEKQIQEVNSLNIFKDVFEPIEKSALPLHTTWGISKILYFGNQSLMPTTCYFNIHKRAMTACGYKFNSKPIFQACKKANEEGQGSTEEEKRLLSKYILEGTLNGLNLETKKQIFLFNEYTKKMNGRIEEFGKKLQYARSTFAFEIKKREKLIGFPEEFLKVVAVDPSQYEVGPWIITLDPYVVRTFLEYCPDPLLRFYIWEESVKLCSQFGEQNLENNSLVHGITNDRADLAKIMGFKNYAEMCMMTKMAGNLQNVFDFLETLRQRAYPFQVKEIEDLRNFAKERGFDGQLQQWDVNFWARKHKKALYNYDEEVLKEYFPLSKVIEGLFELCKNLFNINIVERSKIDVWHRDVRFFDVYDLDVSESEPAGSFYFDPYSRSESKIIVNRNLGWVLLVRDKSHVNNLKPLSSLIYNFQPPSKNGEDSYITFGAVKSLFGNFGHLLQQLLTRAKSYEVAGLANIEWDAANTSQHLLSIWAYDPTILSSISRHRETGEPLDDNTIKNLKDSCNHMIGYNLCTELYLSRFDLDLHGINKSWDKMMKKIWPQYFVFPEHKKNCHVCSWESIFVENNAASYYSNLWSKMLAADAYSAFTENADEEAQRKVGNRYKETYFALGGAVHASEVFRRFRGRDPSIDPLLKQYGFK